MARPKQAVQPGFTLGKIVMIGVLSVVLMFVVYGQFSGSSDSGVLVQPRAARNAEPVPATGIASQLPGKVGTGEQQPWPKWNREELLSHDPFKIPDSLRGRDTTAVNSLDALQIADPNSLTGVTDPLQAEQSAAAEQLIEQEQAARFRKQEVKRRQEETVALLRQAGVGMILQTDRGGVARVGSLELRVGDVFASGLRVDAIDSTGVRLSVVAEPSTN